MELEYLEKFNYQIGKLLEHLIHLHRKGSVMSISLIIEITMIVIRK